MLVPFMLALASNSSALPLSALGAVQRMISHNAVAPQRLPTVTSQLIARAQLPSADESSLLKVLQTVLTIASSPALLYSDTTVSQLLLLCLTLQQSRSAVIKNTASASVQQFVALLLDAVAEERPAPPPPVPYDTLVNGLATPRRTFELPGRMTLPAIVDVLFDTWQE